MSLRPLSTRPAAQRYASLCSKASVCPLSADHPAAPRAVCSTERSARSGSPTGSNEHNAGPAQQALLDHQGSKEQCQVACSLLVYMRMCQAEVRADA